MLMSTYRYPVFVDAQYNPEAHLSVSRRFLLQVSHEWLQESRESESIPVLLPHPQAAGLTRLAVHKGL